MAKQNLGHIATMTRSIMAGATLEQDIVRYCAPVLAGIRPAAMFGSPFTRTPLHEMAVDEPQVLMIGEFEQALADCRNQLADGGVQVRVLAWRNASALLYVYRPDLAAQTIAHPHTAANLACLGYRTSDLEGALDELARRIAAFDDLERARDFWDLPHEMGYFLGYPAVDVMAYTRNRGANYTASGTWRVYGCPRRAAMFEPVFAAHEECTLSYWQLYIEGARLSSLALLGTLS